MTRGVPLAETSRKSLSPLGAGEILNGKYEVGEVIGSGGVGVVFAARHIELDEAVAIKVLRADVDADEELVGRFLREAKAAVSLKSEHVVKVLDVSKTPAGVPYLVMEMLRGNDLGTVVSTTGPLSITDAVDYVMQACEALALAHSTGIVHRDIKPENLFLADQGHGLPILKVLDFGISKSALGGSILGSKLPLVRTANLMGTPLYMSPEQVRNQQIDPRADIWALGLVLYELLTGITAFHAESITELTALILDATPEPMKSIRPSIPDGLVTIVEKCIAKDPMRRYSNVAQLASDLLPFAPKRARVSAERASASLQAAGLTSIQVAVPDTIPPPPEVLNHPLLAAVREAERARDISLTTTANPLTVTGSGTQKSSRGMTGVAIAAATIAMAVGLWLFVSRGGRSTQPTVATGTITSLEVKTPPSASVIPADTGKTVILVDRPQTENTTVVTLPPPPVVPEKHATTASARPNAKPKPAPSASVAPAPTGTDPDIGY